MRGDSCTALIISPSLCVSVYTEKYPPFDHYLTGSIRFGSNDPSSVLLKRPVLSERYYSWVSRGSQRQLMVVLMELKGDRKRGGRAWGTASHPVADFCLGRYGELGLIHALKGCGHDV